MEEASATGSTERAVLATIVYHDLIDQPLTAVEVWRYLFRSPRMVSRNTDIQLARVEEALQSLVASGAIETHNGYFTLSGRGVCVPDRIARHALAQEKWRHLRHIAWWLQGIPFLRAVAGGGSLAREHVKEESDFDVFVIVENGRIWTARFFLTIILDVLGLRRRPNGPTRNRVCLNHYVTPSGMEFSHHSIYTALEYARLVPLFGEEYVKAFHDRNRQRMERYLVRVLEDSVPHRKMVSPAPVLRIIRRMGEITLSGAGGRYLERFFERIQRRYMKHTNIRSDIPGRVIAESNHLEFHPASPEAPLMDAFNNRTRALGLSEFTNQKDSGLVSSFPILDKG